ncbi:MAG TPA: lytic transglycosylase domain-containing protein [Vicinamibacterales bacterium]|nr:lytic transglycosylase domain-containing protein [Vicinamibacterales bacterium]
MPENTPELQPPLERRVTDGHIERRQNSRRTQSRFKPDRRRGERRKQRIRTLLLAAAALAASPWMKSRPLFPTVAVELSNFNPQRPETAYEALIQEAANLHDLDAALIRAVMRTESAFNPTAVSPVGAQGLMQLMPALAREMGVVDAFDPRDNIMGGAKYLKQLLTAQRGNIPLTLASYNAGPGNVRKFKGIPPFKETRNYVRKITELLEESE